MTFAVTWVNHSHLTCVGADELLHGNYFYRPQKRPADKFNISKGRRTQGNLLCRPIQFRPVSELTTYGCLQVCSKSG